MDCEGCARNVTNALKSIKGVSRAEVSLEKRRVLVWLDSDRTNEERIRSAIRKAGYLVGDVLPKGLMCEMDDSKRGLEAKCANCAGGAGIAICTVFMLLSGVGVAAVGLSQVGGMAGMGGSSPAQGGGLLYPAIRLISGPFGEVILLASFGLMVAGMWLGRKVKPLALALIAAVTLFAGMYSYFSIGMIATGSAILIAAYAAAYSRRFSKLVKLR